MNPKTLLTTARRVFAAALTLVLMLTVSIPAHGAFQEIIASHNGAKFTYELFLMDQNGVTVINPREMKAGDTLYVEIRLTRNQYSETSYDSYGIEFDLTSRGLRYNSDGATFRNGTDVYIENYTAGDNVGFAWYDMAQVGEAFANPVVAGSWSYTVEDPTIVNITVPVALIYITGDQQEHVPVGNARLYLDVNGGELLGKDVSGEYLSGTKVTLPDAKKGELVFEGWSDGVKLYPAGSEYSVSGVVTLTAQWQEPERNLHLILNANGGDILGEDVTGHYAEGEIVILPDAQREGYIFTGWGDGTNVHPANAEYTVTGSVVLFAQWEEGVVIPSEETEPNSDIAVLLLGILALLLGLLLLILLLWKRRYVKYSLVNGDVALVFNNGDAPAKIAVVLCDGETEYPLNTSGILAAGEKLRHIKNVTNLPIAPVEPGKYEGKLLISDGSTITVKKCRIKVLDRVLEQ